MFRRLFRREPKEKKQRADRRRTRPEAKERPEGRETRQVEAQKDQRIVRRTGREKEIARRRRRDDVLEQRERRAAESILENESLTADLDDKTAKELIDWGIAGAKTAAQGTAGLDDEQADEIISEHLRATRHMMRSVNKLVSKRAEIDVDEIAQLLDKINEQITTIYGKDNLPQEDKRRQDLLNRLAEPAQDPVRILAELRGLFEKPGESPARRPGEENG